MAARNYESPDLRIIGDGLLGGEVPGEGSQDTPTNPAELSYSVWKDLIGAKNSSYQDYVAWMNQNGYGEFIQDEKYR